MQPLWAVSFRRNEGTAGRHVGYRIQHLRLAEQPEALPVHG
jgi:hypothetical protein